LELLSPLLNNQKAETTLLLQKAFPLKSNLSDIDPHFIQPLGETHYDFVEQFTKSKTILLYNASGAGRTKIAYSISISKVIITHKYT